MENDSPEAGESLTIDQAAARYSEAMASKEVREDQSETPEQEETGTTTDDELPEGDEPESEDDDGQTAEEDQAEDGEDEPETDQGRFVADNAKVKLPDGTVATVADLKSGSLRNADYTRKTQEVAEQRKAVEAQSSALKASEEKLTQQREYNIALLKSIIPQPPDPSRADPRSANYDPAGYQADEVAYRQWSQHLQYLESQQTQAQQDRQKKATETERETADREWNALTDKLSHLKDGKKAEAFIGEIRKYGTETYGFKPEEMKGIALDHRLALVLNDAIKWNKLQASKATVARKVEGRPPVQRGGKRSDPQARRANAVTDAKARLQQSGRLDDAVALLLATQK